MSPLFSMMEDVCSVAASSPASRYSIRFKFRVSSSNQSHRCRANVKRVGGGLVPVSRTARLDRRLPVGHNRSNDGSDGVGGVEGGRVVADDAASSPGSRVRRHLPAAKPSWRVRASNGAAGRRPRKLHGKLAHPLAGAPCTLRYSQILLSSSSNQPVALHPLLQPAPSNSECPPNPSSAYAPSPPRRLDFWPQIPEHVSLFCNSLRTLPPNLILPLLHIARIPQ
jgi:hypothetical protein